MIRRNDVVTVADRSGEATGKPRPAIIVTADAFATLDWIVICPLTAQPPTPGVILMREIMRSDRLPLRERSWAEPHKITAIRRRRIGRCIGVLSDAEALWLNRVLVQLLGVASSR
jgi:mRNA interferase MazF